MRKKIAVILLLFPLIANLGLAEVTEHSEYNNWSAPKLDPDKLVQKLEMKKTENKVQIKPEVNKGKKVEPKINGIPIKVKLNYSDPKISFKNGIYYVNGNPYRGRVYMSHGNVVNEIGLEDYLYSVVSAEMPVYFGKEALKAQAVAARTYAIHTILNNKNDGFDIHSSDLSQVYKGMKNEKKEIIQAVNATKDEVVTYKGKPILALYHSASGDKTKTSKEIFNEEYPYLQSVEDFSNSKKWEYVISRKEIEKKLKMSYDKIPYLNKNKIRRALGSSKVKSTNFTMKQIGKDIHIRGKGYGHGVGLSQWGAKYLGQTKKYTYKQILAHYYKGTKVQKLGDIKWR